MFVRPSIGVVASAWLLCLSVIKKDVYSLCLLVPMRRYGLCFCHRESLRMSCDLQYAPIIHREVGVAYEPISLSQGAVAYVFVPVRRCGFCACQ